MPSNNVLHATIQIQTKCTVLDNGKCALCLREEDAKYRLLDCKDTKLWRMKFRHDKWLNMNKEVAYRKMVKIANKAHGQNLGKFLDTSRINGLI
jgi:hypothetical protein